MKLVLLSILSLGVLSGLSNAIAADSAHRQIINEMRRIKSSLPANDPGRPELSLRLADRLVDEAFTGTEKDKKGAADRKEALSLYKEVLQTKSVTSNPALTTKVRFQMSRLYLEDGNISDASPLLKQVSQQSDLVPLKRESLLRLAEIAESNPKTYRDADQYYQQVLAICAGTDTCSFANYRLAWMDRNANQMEQAIEKMTQALWDSKGNIREESLRDWIAFQGLYPAGLNKAMEQVELLSQKLNRPNMMQDLAYSYFSNGQKASGVAALAIYNSRSPTLNNQVRLLEEYYGLRDWDQFRNSLAAFEEIVSKGAVGTPEIEKITRRLATQLDGERTTDKTKSADFSSFTASNILLFPDSKDKMHMIEGLIAAAPSPEAKVAEAKRWLNEPKIKLSVAEQKIIREMRASIAQKAAPQNSAMYTVVIEEMTALNQIQPDQKYSYAEAKARYDLKENDAALVIFQKIAASGTGDLAVQSQNLALEILNQQKRLPELIAQADAWTANSKIVDAAAKNAGLKKELAEMSEVKEEAVFALAVSKGDSQDALNVFLPMCLNKKHLPQSCDNAKVLSVRLKQHPVLIQVLSELKDQKSLIQEYEFAGYFSETADLLKKQQAKPTIAEQFRLALLYELGRNSSAQKNQVKEILAAVAKIKPSEAEENLLFSLASELGLINASALKLPLSQSWKIRVAELLEKQKSGNAETKKILMAQTAIQSAEAAQYVLNEANSLAVKTSKIQFYGRNGQSQFKKRVAQLAELKLFCEKYLVGGSTVASRVDLINVMVNAYQGLVTEIEKSPIPAELNSEQVAQIQAGLTEMAKPFAEQVAALNSLLASEKSKVSASEVAPRQVSSSSLDMAGFEQNYKTALNEFHKNPYDMAGIQKLKSIADSASQNRISLYFEGRSKGERSSHE